MDAKRLNQMVRKFTDFMKRPIGLCLLCFFLAVASFSVLSYLIHEQEEARSVASMLMPDPYGNFTEKYPDIALKIARGNSYDIAVASDKIDTYEKIRTGCLIVFGAGTMFFGAVAYLENRKKKTSSI